MKKILIVICLLFSNIEIYFRRPSQNEERKYVFTDFHDKIEIKDVKLLKFE